MNQNDLYTSFGFFSGQPVLIGLILFFQLIYIPYAEVYIVSQRSTHIVYIFHVCAGLFVLSDPAGEEV